MDTLVVLEVIAVLTAWALVFLTIRRWGPGRARRSVQCPAKRVRAQVVVEQQESDFGSLRVTDVTACSLFPQQPVTCDKQCLSQF